MIVEVRIPLTESRCRVRSCQVETRVHFILYNTKCDNCVSSTLKTRSVCLQQFRCRGSIFTDNPETTQTLIFATYRRKVQQLEFRLSGADGRGHSVWEVSLVCNIMLHTKFYPKLTKCLVVICYRLAEQESVSMVILAIYVFKYTKFYFGWGSTHRWRADSAP